MTYLTGKRVLVTRAKGQNKAFSKKLIEAQAIPVEVPLLTFQLPNNINAIQQEFSKLQSYTWTVFTSVNGVQYFFELLDRFQVAFPDTMKIAAVGIKTEQALQEYGRKADLIPDEFVGESLAEHLMRVLTKQDAVFMPRGQLARKKLYDELVQFGVRVSDVTIYETVRNDAIKDTLNTMIQLEQIDVLTFTSPSTVRFFIELLEEQNRTYIKDAIICSIGPITTAECMRQQLPVAIEATPYTIDGMIDAMQQFFKRSE